MKSVPVFVTSDIESCKLCDYTIMVIVFLQLEITFHNMASQQKKKLSVI